jgi:hypothetical protein
VKSKAEYAPFRTEIGNLNHAKYKKEKVGKVEYVSNPHMRHDGKVEKISL